MGQLIDGVWHTGWYDPDKRGAFQRPASKFRNRPTAITAGRYRLYVSYACPWAHRAIIMRSLRGLTDALPMTVMDPKMGDDGWVYDGGLLRDVYLRADPKYSGRVTVPVLWDEQTGTIVNNESREVMRLLDVEFAPLGVQPLEPSLAPPELVRDGSIDRVLDEIYAPINNGVYRAGFASTQAAYEEAARELFAALAHWEGVLARQPFTCGDRMTEADVALFTTLLRFDLVYYSHFKCNLRALRDHPALWRFTRRMYQHPGIRPTCHLDHIKTHYYWSQTTVNPTRVVPIGPTLDLE